MPLFLYLPTGTTFLAERRLQSATEPCVLLVSEGAAASAEALRRRFQCIEQGIALDSEEIVPSVADYLQRGAAPEVVLPMSFDMNLAHYRVPLHVPRLSPHYAIFRRLWQVGFRRAEIFTLHGSRVFELPHLLDSFKDKHAGRRCFVIGNGPSLSDMDMSLLKDEITLGSNRCYLGYEKWGYPFTYWGVYDRYQIERYCTEYEACVPAGTVKFFPFEYLPMVAFSEGCPVNSVWSKQPQRRFSSDPGEIYVGFTVTYMLLQIAAVMGCDPIILIGADHRYNLKRRFHSDTLRRIRRGLVSRFRGGAVYDAAVAAHDAWRQRRFSALQQDETLLWSSDDAATPTHFDERYAGGEKKRFLPPEPLEAERDFNCAAVWANKNKRRILNATPGSALHSFPRVDFSSLF